MIEAGSYNGLNGSRREVGGGEHRRWAAEAGERVLVVDDDPLIRDICGAMLSDILGYAVRLCTGGREALAALETAEEPFDVVISDIKMPVMNGFELSREILRRWPGLPVILFSGFAEPELVAAALQQGVEEFVDKPFSSTVIGRAVRRALDGRAAAAP